MEKLTFASGIKEYEVNDTGVLRFNPSDPNVYARFLDALDKIKSLEEQLVKKAKEIEAEDEMSGVAGLKLLAAADREIKNILTGVFGARNDFDEIFGGQNLLGVAENGERILTNFLEALQPIIVAGAEKCAKQQAEAAVAEAKKSRALRQVQ